MLSEKKLQAFLKSKYNLCIGERTAEDLKHILAKIDKGAIKVSGRSYKADMKETVSVPLKDLIT